MKRLIITMLFSVIFLSCSKDAPSAGGAEGKALRHAYSLLNQGRELEALDIANAYLEVHPESIKWISVKAEAYVSEAGLRAESLISLAEKLESLSEIEDSLHKKVQQEFINDMKSNSDPKIRSMAKVFGEFLNVLDALSVVYVSFQSISDIPVEKVYLLAEASVILSTTEQLPDEMRIFRVVVNLLILKFKLKYNYYFEGSVPGSCLEIEALNEKFEELNFELFKVADDLKILYPGNKTFSDMTLNNKAINFDSFSSPWGAEDRANLELIIGFFQRIGSDQKPISEGAEALCF